MLLNFLQLQAAKAEPKPYKLHDENGLFLIVMPNGSKYWRYRYRMYGKQKELAIGVFPTIGIVEARAALISAKEQIKSGDDPSSKQRETKQLAQYHSAQTFEAIAKEWHEQNETSWTPRHAAYVLRRLELHTFNAIGNYPINKLTPALIMTCLQRVEKSGPEMARRVLNMCSRIFQYAAATGRIDRDLTFGLKHGLRKYRPGHYASVTLDEMPDLIKTIHMNEARLYRQTHLCLKMMLLTFVRTTELIEARWTEIDFDKAMWIIPAERMKTRKLHKVPLSNQALSILQELKEMNGKRDFVFPSIPRPRKPMSNATILKALDLLKYKHRMTGHGFRSLAMGILKQNLGYRHEPVDRQLAHMPRNSVDRAYDRADYLPERIIMMQEYADYIDSIIHNKPYERTKHDRHDQPAQLTTAAATQHTTAKFSGGTQSFTYQYVYPGQPDTGRTIPKAT